MNCESTCLLFILFYIIYYQQKSPLFCQYCYGFILSLRCVILDSWILKFADLPNINEVMIQTFIHK